MLGFCIYVWPFSQDEILGERVQQEYKDEPIEHISPKESKDDDEDEEESKHTADELITEKIEIGKS